jgi:hypothetical protein
VVWANVSAAGGSSAIRSPVDPGTFCLGAPSLTLLPCADTSPWQYEGQQLKLAADPSKCLSAAPPAMPLQANVFAVPDPTSGTQRYAVAIGGPANSTVTVSLRLPQTSSRAVKVQAAVPGTKTYQPITAFRMSAPGLVLCNATVTRGSLVLLVDFV